MNLDILSSIANNNKVFKKIKDSVYIQGNVKMVNTIDFDVDNDVINIYNSIKNKEIDTCKDKRNDTIKDSRVDNVECELKYRNNGTEFKTTFIHSILMTIDPTASLLSYESREKLLSDLQKEMLNKVEMIHIEKKNGPKYSDIREILLKNNSCDQMFNFMSLYLNKTIIILDLDSITRYTYGKFSECVWILKRNGSYFAIDDEDVKDEKFITKIYTKDELDNMNYQSLCKVFKMMLNEKRTTKKELVEKINMLYT